MKSPVRMHFFCFAASLFLYKIELQYSHSQDLIWVPSNYTLKDLSAYALPQKSAKNISWF